MLANLGVNWASQDFAGACRSLRLQHYANAWLREIAVLTFYGNARYLRDHYGCYYCRLLSSFYCAQFPPNYAVL